MSPTNANKSVGCSRAAFTLVELIVSVGLSAIIFAGVLAGFTFLGRNLTRLMNTRDQEANSRRAFYLLGQDVSAATAVKTSTTTHLEVQLIARKPDGTPDMNPDGITPKTKIVKYDYNHDAVSQENVLTRTVSPVINLDDVGDSSDPRAVVLRKISDLKFQYFDTAGSQVAKDPSDANGTTTLPLSIKEVELSFTSAAGNAASGTQARYSGVSPRLLLRNRPLLQ